METSCVNTVTRPSSDEADACEICKACGSQLVLPQSEFTVPPKADYVCLKCGHAYRWAGEPPPLMRIMTHGPRND